MLVIPAIDIRDGRCVRLRQGSYSEETVYFEDPVKMAKLWRVQNAKTLHIVDLDAAKGGDDHNRPIVRRICEELDIPIQVGGGIRSIEDVGAMLSCGAYRVVIGTAAVKNPELISEAVEEFSSRRVVAGIDAKDGEVRVEGWTEGSGVDAVELAREMEERGCCRIVYTDISRDGTMKGPNLEAYQTMNDAVSDLRITASGGIGGYEDLKALMDLEAERVDSVIVGKALYENAFPCQQFWGWHEKEELDLDRFSTAPLRQPDQDC